MTISAWALLWNILHVAAPNQRQRCSDRLCAWINPWEEKSLNLSGPEDIIELKKKNVFHGDHSEQGKGYTWNRPQILHQKIMISCMFTEVCYSSMMLSIWEFTACHVLLRGLFYESHWLLLLCLWAGSSLSLNPPHSGIPQRSSLSQVLAQVIWSSLLPLNTCSVITTPIHIYISSPDLSLEFQLSIQHPHLNVSRRHLKCNRSKIALLSWQICFSHSQPHPHGWQLWLDSNASPKLCWCSSLANPDGSTWEKSSPESDTLYHFDHSLHSPCRYQLSPRLLKSLPSDCLVFLLFSAAARMRLLKVRSCHSGQTLSRASYLMCQSQCLCCCCCFLEGKVIRFVCLFMMRYWG